jgi:hypothetical protein
MRSIQSTHNLVAVSANDKETAINTEQTLDTGMLAARASIPDFSPRIENNADEATGKEEADTIYDLGANFAFAMDFGKAQCQHMAFIAGYGLGVVTTVPAGATGYRHTITPIDGDLDDSRSNPSFTLAYRLGKRLITERQASCFVDSFTLSLAKDAWMKLTSQVKGTGKRSTNNLKESVAGFCDDTAVTLGDTISGTTAAERLDNVHHVRYQKPATLEWVDVVVTAASDASPCVLTITAPGGGHVATIYEVIYNAHEAGDHAWATLPARVIEPPLRPTDFIVNFGGKWDGSALLGGHQVQADINNFEWSFNNNLTPEHTPGAGSTQYCNRALRDGRTQTIKFDRIMREAILRQWMSSQSTFVLYAKAEYPTVYEAGHKYTVEIVFPKVGVLNAPVKESGKRLSEEATFQVLEDDTYGSVIVYVKNKVATYAV